MTAKRKLARRSAIVGTIRELAGPGATLGAHRETPWASITFSGWRHDMRLNFGGEEGIAAAERFVDRLSDHEFAIPGQLVADATVTIMLVRHLPVPSAEVDIEVLVLDED